MQLIQQRFIEISLARFVGNLFFRNLHVLHLYIRHDIKAVLAVHFKHKINIYAIIIYFKLKEEMYIFRETSNFYFIIYAQSSTRGIFIRCCSIFVSILPSSVNNIALVMFFRQNIYYSLKNTLLTNIFGVRLSFKYDVEVLQ